MYRRLKIVRFIAVLVLQPLRWCARRLEPRRGRHNPVTSTHTSSPRGVLRNHSNGKHDIGHMTSTPCGANTA
ncbi:Uncharacterised protein [Mycobacteroides abscessus subsp. abscessus]|nr:Uncharacterised protein [Mycobacteroides abscessus subsp. abscessus]